MSEEEDRRLVAECLTGHREAFAGLVDKYQKVLFNIALRMVRDYDDARDVTQSAFVKAYEKLDTYKPEYKFYSWLYRIALHEALNLMGRRRRHEPLDERLPAEGRGPDRDHEQAILNDQIDSALQELSPDHRIVVILRHFLQMSMRDIGVVLEIPEKTVKSRLFTARHVLGNLLLRRGVV